MPQQWSRRRFVSALGGAAVAAQSRRPPNIILIYADDLGSGDLGCYGAADVKTPHLDRLAASGARFSQFYSAAPMCSPSRAALLTGRYPIRCGVPVNVRSQANAPGLPPTEVTLAEALRERGYRTALAGKWHLGSAPECRPNAQGFDEFFGFHSGCVDYYSHIFYWGGGADPFHDLWRNQTEVWENGAYLTESITREACRFVRENRQRPFFLYTAYNAPHYPMHAPQRYLDRFPGLDRERQVHAAMIAAMDDGIGEIVATVDRMGLREDTIVYFQSDNGATIETRAGRGGRNNPYRGFKFSLLEGGIRVPALMSWPGTIPAGQVVKEPAVAMDIFPTLAGTREALDGRDLMPLVKRGERPSRAALYWAQGEQGAVRRGRWKLVRNGILGPGPENRLGGDDAVFLADLDDDPGETVNLRRRRPEVAEEMNAAWERWRAGLKQG